MAHDEPNVFVMENRISVLEHTAETLAVVARGQTEVNHSLQETMKLLQQAHNDFVRRYESEEGRFQSEDAPKIKTLWENRSQFKGGWMVISALGGLLIGGVAVATFLMQFVHK